MPKTKICSIIAVVLFTCGVANSQAVGHKVEGAINIGTARSLGEPSQVEFDAFDPNGRFSQLSTAADSLPETEDIRNWTDEQIVHYYQDEWNYTQNMLDQAAAGQREVLDYGVASTGRASHVSSSGMSCLGVAIQGEAGGEPQAGKVAVGQTILDRAHGNPLKLCSVVFAAGQFESMMYRQRGISADAMRAARSVLASGSKTCGWDYFLNKRLQRADGRAIPSWTYNLERRGCKHARIGQQDFYSSQCCGGRVASSSNKRRRV